MEAQPKTIGQMLKEIEDARRSACTLFSDLATLTRVYADGIGTRAQEKERGQDVE